MTKIPSTNSHKLRAEPRERTPWGDIMKAFVSMLLLQWSLAVGPAFAQAHPLSCT